MADAGAVLRANWRAARSGLFTDLYELAMARIYHREGLADRPATFDYFYRSNPDYGDHRAGCCVSAGIGPFVEWLRDLVVDETQLAALGRLRDPAGRPLFEPSFLSWLGAPDRFRCLRIESVDEGRVVHPHEPIAVVEGPLAVAQLVETALLNHLNYATLVATKAARVVQAAGGGRVLEFGMRRGPGAGANEGVRSALIAGCAATSNVEAAVALGGTPSGTHAHSLVQAYEALGMGELEAFRAMAHAAPDGCVLLVDTIETLGSGVPNAIRVFEELRRDGHRPAGVRLDSGDLGLLAVHTAAALDEAGFTDVPIVLSGDLDELEITRILDRVGEVAASLRLDSAAVRARLTYGVGTRMISSHGASALNGVYKLAAIDDGHGAWVPAIKLSESRSKIPIPGPTDLWRLYDRRGLAVADLITLAGEQPFDDGPAMTLPLAAGDEEGPVTVERDAITRCERLRRTLLDGGVAAESVGMSIDGPRARCTADLGCLPAEVKDLVDPGRYAVALSARLHAHRLEVIAAARR
jgi:nicotinate phosphoribosyltransferase